MDPKRALTDQSAFDRSGATLGVLHCGLMTAARLRLLLVLTFAVQYVAPGPTVAQTARTRSDVNLPPMSYTCPMHPDVLEGDPGTCPLCKMNLVGVRLVSMWTCPVHSVITEPKAGKCPIDHRDLIQVTLAISWTCQGRSDVNQLAPGKCPDGTDMLVKYSTRPHGNHNPQHGGQFFMAPDNWHHLEGALPRPGLVRIYLYDDYSKPLPLDQAKRVQARIVTKETVDPVTKAAKEIASPLVLTRDGQGKDREWPTFHVSSQAKPISQQRVQQCRRLRHQRLAAHSRVRFGIDSEPG